jgi:hypothetical protein
VERPEGEMVEVIAGTKRKLQHIITKYAVHYSRI